MTTDNNKLVHYAIRMHPGQWARFQALLERESKRAGRRQVAADLLRQVMELGMQQLEKK